MTKNITILVIIIILSYFGYAFKSPIRLVNTCYEQNECYPSFFNTKTTYNPEAKSYHVVITIETDRNVVLYDYSSLLEKEMKVRAILLCKNAFDVKDIKMEVTESYKPTKNYIPDKFYYPYLKINTAEVYCK